MKKLMVAMSAALMLTACGNETELSGRLQTANDSIENVTIEFVIPMTTSTQAMTRGELSASQMTDLWLFDYVGDELQQTIHQSSTDTGFGSVAINTTTGNHIFCFVASRGTEPTVSGGTITWAKPSDTFWKAVSMSVTPTTATAQPVVLDRAATRLKVNITDEVPTTLASLSITADTWHCGIDAKSGQPTTATARISNITVPASYQGTTGQLSASIFGIAGDDFTTDVSITAMDGNSQQIATVSVDDVTMKRNITTQLSGPLFTRQPVFGLNLAEDWGEDIDINW